MFGNLWGRNDNTVMVIKGDTLYSISRRHNVPLRSLIEANNLSPPYNLRIGQVLQLPQVRAHVVAKGDTLYNISRRHNVDQASLARLNNLRPPYTLAIGQRLALPASVVSGSNQTRIASQPQPQQATARPSPAPTTGATSTTVQRPAHTPVAVSQTRSAKFAWPVRGQIVSPFGAIAKGRHNDGINIKAPRGTDIRAADKGAVVYAGNELKGFGNLILIRHDDGWVTAYAHADTLLVKKGQRVARGEKIATVGSTGNVSTPQLHFEIRRGRKPVNPINHLEKR
jgi:murein DD-endopeptidase MepM/ murein hydrolase activator NlpD